MDGFTDARYFNAHFEHAPVPVAWVGIDGRFQFANQKLCELLGYAKGELEEKTWQSLTHPEDLQADCNEVDRITDSNADHYQMVKRYLTKQGNTVWIQLHVRPIRNVNGTVLRFVSWIIPLPNGGRFKVERTGDKIEVRPAAKLQDIILENPKVSAIIFAALILAIGEQFLTNLSRLLKLFNGVPLLLLTGSRLCF